MSTFEELGVAPQIGRAIMEMGFEHPMPIQEKVIPYLLETDNDITALAQTGTGKTAAFGLPILQKTNVADNFPQTLILAPTRELCLQIAGDLRDFAKYIDGIHILPVYGGSSIESQIKSLRRGVHIVVATPGRLLDLMRRKKVSLAGLQHVVLDEADEMLDMGFSEDLNAILSEVPAKHNTLLFSATMSPEIEKIASNYLHDATEIVIGNKNESTNSVNHIYFCVHAKDKYAALKRIVDYHPDIYGIVFCRTRLETQEVADKLIQDGYNADALHGELTQAARDTVMQKFRQRHLQLLVATDIAARGLDVDDLTHVINYGLPDDKEYYTHRSGRTGRAGKTGTSIAIINVKEKRKMRDIERFIGKQFSTREMPTGQQICEKQLFNLIDDLERVQVNEEDIDKFMPVVYKKLEWLDREDLIKRMVSMEFNRFLDYYHDRDDIELITEEKSKRKDGEKRKKGKNGPQAEEGFTRFFINMGKIDRFHPKDLISLINKNTKERINIGRIDLMKSFSFFEVEEKFTGLILKQLNKTHFNGRNVSVEIAGGEGNKEQAPEKKKETSKRKEQAPAKKSKKKEAPRYKEEDEVLITPKALKAERNGKKNRNKNKKEKKKFTKDDWKQLFEQYNQ